MNGAEPGLKAAFSENLSLTWKEKEDKINSGTRAFKDRYWLIT